MQNNNNDNKNKDLENLEEMGVLYDSYFESGFHLEARLKLPFFVNIQRDKEIMGIIDLASADIQEKGTKDLEAVKKFQGNMSEVFKIVAKNYGVPMNNDNAWKGAEMAIKSSGLNKSPTGLAEGVQHITRLNPYLNFSYDQKNMYAHTTEFLSGRSSASSEGIKDTFKKMPELKFLSYIDKHGWSKGLVMIVCGTVLADYSLSMIRDGVYSTTGHFTDVAKERLGNAIGSMEDAAKKRWGNHVDNMRFILIDDPKKQLVDAIDDIQDNLDPRPFRCALEMHIKLEGLNK